MDDTDSWHTSVTELVLLVRDGLLALLPILEKAHIDWTDGQQYDDWDAVAEGLFDGIVRMSVAHSIECNECDIPRYGFWPPHDCKNYILVRDGAGERLGIFTMFSSRDDEPFSHVGVHVQPVKDSEMQFHRIADCRFLLLKGDTGEEFAELTVRL